MIIFNFIDVTKRELLVGMMIASVMLIIGVCINDSICEAIHKWNHKINTAIDIDDADKLSYFLETEAGSFISDDTLVASKPVTIEGLDGYYMAIKRNTEQYTRHTRTVSTTDGKGHIHTHTEAYYSWDVIKKENIISDSITFMNQKVIINELPDEKYMLKKPISHNKRYVFYAIPEKVFGTMFGESEDGSVRVIEFIEGVEVQEYIKGKRRMERIVPIIFGILWTILSIVIILWFWKGEYELLEKE